MSNLLVGQYLTRLFNYLSKKILRNYIFIETVKNQVDIWNFSRGWINTTWGDACDLILFLFNAMAVWDYLLVIRNPTSRPFLGRTVRDWLPLPARWCDILILRADLRVWAASFSTARRNIGSFGPRRRGTGLFCPNFKVAQSDIFSLNGDMFSYDTCQCLETAPADRQKVMFAKINCQAGGLPFCRYPSRVGKRKKFSRPEKMSDWQKGSQQCSQ